ncbi:MAG: hypothetical protein PHO58_05800 [Bacilli bacterium]|nr:hypothetical protein [Bacilli bacterium]
MEENYEYKKPSIIKNIIYYLEYIIKGYFLFNFAMLILQRWLDKNNINDSVFVIASDGWSTDNDIRYKELMHM